MIYLGIDVSKLTLDAAFASPKTGKMLHKKAANTASGFSFLLDWVRDKTHCTVDQIQVILEATGVYHEDCAYACFGAGAKVAIANPARVLHHAKSNGLLGKSDKADAKVLADYGAKNTCWHAWLPPPPNVRLLKSLISRLATVKDERRRELNRLGQTEFGLTHSLVKDCIRKNIEGMTAEIKLLQQTIEQFFTENPALHAQRNLLKSIPAIANVSADLLLCMLLSKPLESARKAAALCGLIPVSRQSGTSVRTKPRLSKAGDPSLRAALYMAAVVAIRYNPPLKAIYERLQANGKAKMSALGAIMRHLVHIAYGVLKHNLPFNANLVTKGVAI